MKLPKERSKNVIDRTVASDTDKFKQRVKHAWNNTMTDIGFRERKVEGLRDPWKKRKTK